MTSKQKQDKGEKKNPLRFTFLAAAVLGAWELLGNLAAGILYLAAKDPFLTASEAASIGIIGGADGPTAVLVASPGWTHWLVPVVLLSVGIFGFFSLSRCRQK